MKNKITPAISSLLNDENMPLIEKIELFVDEYIDLIIKTHWSLHLLHGN